MTLACNPFNCGSGRLRFCQQRVELVLIEHCNFATGSKTGAHASSAMSCMQQTNLAEVGTGAQMIDNDFAAVGMFDECLDVTSGNDVEVVRRAALLDNDSAGSIRVDVGVTHNPSLLLECQSGERLCDIFVDDPTIGDDHSATDAPCHIAVVGDHQDRFALIDQPFEEGEHLLRRFRVEVAGWLIGKNDRRVVGEGAGNGDALLLPAGYGGWQFMRLVSHTDLIEQHHRPFTSLARREHIAEVHRQHNVLDQRERR